jgi:hypothetical protein
MAAMFAPFKNYSGGFGRLACIDTSIGLTDFAFRVNGKLLPAIDADNVFNCHGQSFPLPETRFPSQG